MCKTIVCYGDSNTWGYIPGVASRFPKSKRWTGVCQDLLGEGFEVVEEGLNGRATIYDDPFNPYLNGKRGLGYSLISKKPIDLVVLFLGTNDLKFTDAHGAAKGIEELVELILNADSTYIVSQPIFPNGVKILLVSPAVVAPEIEYVRPESLVAGKSQETLKFSLLYEQIAKKYGVYFLDAALYAKPSLADCVHIDADGHQLLGTAIAAKIKEIFTDN